MEEGTKCRRDCRRKQEPAARTAVSAWQYIIGCRGMRWSGVGELLSGSGCGCDNSSRVQEAGAPHTGAMGRHQRHVASARERTRARERDSERAREGERMSWRSTLRLASAKTRGLDAGWRGTRCHPRARLLRLPSQRHIASIASHNGSHRSRSHI